MHQIYFDDDGFLKNLSDWNTELAQTIAAKENIFISTAHWEIILLARNFYQEFQLSPSMRALVKYTAKKLGDEKGKSIYLLSLFPNSPAKLIAKIAGLPKPANCL